VVSTAAVGALPQQVEALAFAWLARAFSRRDPGNLEAVTGAAGPRVLGALYPAKARL
jgi:anhydro-N-acetylmuramic acid kinase